MVLVAYRLLEEGLTRVLTYEQILLVFVPGVNNIYTRCLLLVALDFRDTERERERASVHHRVGFSPTGSSVM